MTLYMFLFVGCILTLNRFIRVGERGHSVRLLLKRERTDIT